MADEIQRWWKRKDKGNKSDKYNLGYGSVILASASL